MMPPGDHASLQGNALLTRLWQRTEQAGCIRHTQGTAILTRHMRAATLPPLSGLLLRRAHSADYTTPDPPVIVTASPAEPTPLPRAARRSPTARAIPIPLNGATSPTPHPALPEPPGPAVPSSPEAPSGPGPHSGPEVFNGRGPVAGRGPAGGGGGADGQAAQSRQRSFAEPDAPSATGAQVHTRSTSATRPSAAPADSARPVVAARPLPDAPPMSAGQNGRNMAVMTHDHGAAPPDARPRVRPAEISGQRQVEATALAPPRPSKLPTQPTRPPRPVVRERLSGPEAWWPQRRRPRARDEVDSQGIATRVLPTVLWQANPRVDRPAEPAHGGRVPQEQHPASQRGQASRRTDPPGRHDDPAKRDRDTPQPPPRIDIDGIVTTVQRRLVHHMAIERERRGMLR
jgi:hypothetical protein